jgi:hypothetical protein
VDLSGISPGGSNNDWRGDQRSSRQIMYDRWHRSNYISIPQLDQKDIAEQGHCKYEKACPLDEMRQHHPEFTHSSYLRLRSQEDAIAICNYLENLPKQQARIEKLSMSQKLHEVFNKKLNLD